MNKKVVSLPEPNEVVQPTGSIVKNLKSNENWQKVYQSIRNQKEVKKKNSDTWWLVVEPTS